MISSVPSLVSAEIGEITGSIGRMNVDVTNKNNCGICLCCLHDTKCISEVEDKMHVRNHRKMQNAISGKAKRLA